MDKDRWAKIAFEMQEHIDELERIAKREKLNTVVVSLFGTSKYICSSETSALYTEGIDHYESNMGVDGQLAVNVNGDTYRTYTRT